MAKQTSERKVDIRQTPQTISNDQQLRTHCVRMHKCWLICLSLNLLIMAQKLDGLCWQISSLHTLSFALNMTLPLYNTPCYKFTTSFADLMQVWTWRNLLNRWSVGPKRSVNPPLTALWKYSFFLTYLLKETQYIVTTSRVIGHCQIDRSQNIASLNSHSLL